MVKPVDVCEATMMVRSTRVHAGEQYMIVRWLEMVDGNELRYCLSNVEDCICGRRALSLIPVKKLGAKIQNSALGPRTKPVYYKLTEVSRAKILPLAKLK